MEGRANEVSEELWLREIYLNQFEFFYFMSLEKDCLNLCNDLMKSHPSGRILRVINTNDPWGDNPMFRVNHQKGNYKTHYVVEDGSQIFDPFLDKPIPKREYLKKVYQNHDELRFSEP